MSESKKEEFRVSGTSRVFGHEPGDVFEQEIPEPQRSQLIEGGAIEPTSGETGKPVSLTEPKTPETPEESADKSPQSGEGNSGGPKLGARDKKEGS